MPFFNFSNNNRQTIDLNSEELVNYLTDGDSEKYVSANKALANSDLYFRRHQTDGKSFCKIQAKKLMAFHFGKQCLHNCF